MSIVSTIGKSLCKLIFPTGSGPPLRWVEVESKLLSKDVHKDVGMVIQQWQFKKIDIGRGKWVSSPPMTCTCSSTTLSSEVRQQISPISEYLYFVVRFLNCSLLRAVHYYQIDCILELRHRLLSLRCVLPRRPTPRVEHILRSPLPAPPTVGSYRI